MSGADSATRPVGGRLRVLCSGTELDEYGEVLAVGDEVDRLGARSRSRYFGTELDDVEWWFDRYADVVGPGSVRIRGRVVAIAAIFVRLTLEPGVGRRALPGSAHLEPLTTTATTREPEIRIAWSEPTEAANGEVYRRGYRISREGDEHLGGWLITLEGARIA